MKILEKSESRISIRLPKKMKKLAERKARTLNISVSQFVKLALIEKINNDKN